MTSEEYLKQLEKYLRKLPQRRQLQRKKQLRLI